MNHLLYTYDSIVLRMDLITHTVLRDNIRLDVFISGSSYISLFGSDISKFKEDWSNWCKKKFLSNTYL